MKIAIAKPDWRIRGGFELVVDRLAEELTTLGHDIRWHLVDVPALSHDPFGVHVQDRYWAESPEFFRYLSMVDAFTDLDVPEGDVVLSTQPPSFATRFRRQLSLFFHHHRIYYDLSDVFLAAGFADPELHHVAQAHVRAVDEVCLARVDRFLVSSEEVRGRLATYNGIVDRVAPCRVGMTRTWTPPARPSPPQHALCVSRHEFPKRTELFVEAMCRTPEVRGVMVGTGGRLPRLRWLHRRLIDLVREEAPVDAALTWCNDGRLDAELDPGAEDDDGSETNLRFLENVSDAALHDLYTSALCVVAPAYREDYGLTALEAMQLGVPVIVCDDGGGLTELVTDGATGLVVPPDGRSIAAAIDRLDGDRELRDELGRNGRAVAAAFTWPRTMQEFTTALDEVTS
jgi:glycosyltransferase involved in cell wall biosynthesis